MRERESEREREREREGKDISYVRHNYVVNELAAHMLTTCQVNIALRQFTRAKVCFGRNSQKNVPQPVLWH